MATIADNLQAVKARIRSAAEAASRDPACITLLAVSKAQPVERIEEARAAGQRAFGENYVQEALEKMAALAAGGEAPLEWHFIGALQSNKTRLVAEHFQWVHAVASEKIARRLSEQRPAALAPLNVLIQVNISGEATKAGIHPAEALALARAIRGLKSLRLRGLMAIPEPTDDVGVQRARFRAAYELFRSLQSEAELDTLSMGMSDDMDAAIAEGATLVRIGMAIFGARSVAPRDRARSVA